MAFKKGEPRPKKAGRKKGSLNKKTRIIDTMGVRNWEDLKGWAEGAGLRKLMAEMGKLKGKDYTQAYNQVTEFVKPKLQRSEVLAEINTNVHWEEKRTYTAQEVPLKEEYLELTLKQTKCLDYLEDRQTTEVLFGGGAGH